ncbi:cell wall hydrolase [Paenibacillus beijingensis]|uniref:Cell wall hydrolase n=1 Tax=Paenibacillus beijingensis TaxID=1126833 RepID=A0A0D5NDT0_9BACL|nr:cell wall hydrolase [Paenibacillus beijingensis]AJY73554.1 cell wall hydrolase [Paenibacillus beijingensis]
MIRKFKPTIIAMVAGLLLLCIGPMSIVSAGAAAASKDVTIKVNSDTVRINDPVFIKEGRIYAPVALIAGLFGAQSRWDKENQELMIHTAFNDHIVLGDGVPVVYFNEVRYWMDAPPFVKDGRLYIPLLQLSELLHANLSVNSDSDVVELITVPQAVVTEESGLDEISKEFGTGKSELLKRNGLDAKATIKSGAKLKVVIPTFFNKKAEPFTEQDLMLLAKITMIEAGHETYEGQLAVANVILNRVKDTRFPDSIRDVIYSGKQFPPAHNGILEKCKPHATALRAAKDALNGNNNVENAVYFFNPDISKGAFWSSLDVKVTIGHHRFAR